MILWYLKILTERHFEMCLLDFFKFCALDWFFNGQETVGKTF
jgi:hypothetical protein